MRVSAIQTTLQPKLAAKTNLKKLREDIPRQEPAQQVSFKGGGGFFYGLGVGGLAVMITLCTAGAGIPAALGVVAIAGGAAGGAALGDKIEEKLSSGKNKK